MTVKPSPPFPKPDFLEDEYFCEWAGETRKGKLVPYREPAMMAKEEEKLVLDFPLSLWQKIFGCKKVELTYLNKIYKFKYVKTWKMSDTFSVQSLDLYYTTKGNYVFKFIDAPMVSASFEDLKKKKSLHALAKCLIEQVENELKQKEIVHL